MTNIDDDCRINIDVICRKSVKSRFLFIRQHLGMLTPFVFKKELYIKKHIMNKILEKRSMILLISFTILAYIVKTAYENIIGNVFVTAVNMALLWNIATNKVERVIVDIAVFVILIAIVVYIVNADITNIILNMISIISISATFVEIKRSQNR